MVSVRISTNLYKWFFLATQIFVCVCHSDPCVCECEFAYLLALHPRKHKGEEFTLFCSFKLVESTTSGHQPHCTSHQLNTAVICPCGTFVHSLLAVETQCTVAHPPSSPYHTQIVSLRPTHAHIHLCTPPPILSHTQHSKGSPSPARAVSSM